MRNRLALTLGTTLLVVAAALALYLSRLSTEDQCTRSNGSIDFQAEVCIMRGVAHPLREAAIRFYTFWGIVGLLIVGATYGMSRMIAAWRRGGTSDGAA
jgi:hypothetical protein